MHVDMPSVMSDNVKMVTEKSYPAMVAHNGCAMSTHVFLIETQHLRTISRANWQRFDINVRKQAEQNIDNWSRGGQSGAYNWFTSSTYGYAARTSKNDRFRIVICSKAMKEAAWKYGHVSQLILDGTFGVSSKKISLFIIMALDEQKRGVPVGMLIFSAKHGHTFTPGSYDTAVLTTMLGDWAKGLGTTKDGAPFAPCLVTTDTAVKEREALNAVFPGVRLRICRFHLRQCWTNKRRTTLGSGRQSSKKDTSPDNKLIRRWLSTLEEDLLKAPSLLAAQAAVAHVRVQLHAFPPIVKLAKKAVDYIDYLSRQWLTTALFHDWSDASRSAAARALSVPLDRIVNMSNHLESFNNVFKNRHLPRWKSGGRRLRIDVLIMVLITEILPDIFARQEAVRQVQRQRRAKFGDTQRSRHQARQQSATAPLAYRHPSAPVSVELVQRRDVLLKNQLVRVVQQTPTHYLFHCHSSLTVEPSCAPSFVPPYVIDVDFVTSEPSGTAVTCSCAGFVKRKSLCSHILAVECALAQWSRRFPLEYREMTLPATISEAYDLAGRLALRNSAASPSSLTAILSLADDTPLCDFSLPPQSEDELDGFHDDSSDDGSGSDDGSSASEAFGSDDDDKDCTSLFHEQFASHPGSTS